MCGGVDRAKAAAVLSVTSRLNQDWYGSSGEMTATEDDGAHEQEL